MTINNVHVLASGRRVTQLVLAERSPTESMIAVRAIRRLLPDLEVRPVMNLAEAESVLTSTRLVTVLVASGLDDRTFSQTIRWFARKTCGIVIAMLEHCEDRRRQEVLEAGASGVWSKPELLVTQLRYELWARLGCAEPARPDSSGESSVRRHGCHRLPVSPERHLTCTSGRTALARQLFELAEDRI